MVGLTNYKIFLDDDRIPLDCIGYMHQRIGKENPIYLEKDWKIVRSYDHFVRTINKMGLPYLISFDHDLADAHYDLAEMSAEDVLKYHENDDREKTGYDCLKWLVDYCMEHKVALPKCYVHSANTPGCINLISYINNFKKHQEENGL